MTFSGSKGSDEDEAPYDSTYKEEPLVLGKRSDAKKEKVTAVTAHSPCAHSDVTLSM